MNVELALLSRLKADATGSAARIGSIFISSPS
jgi:hypothetical protein